MTKAAKTFTKSGSVSKNNVSLNDDVFNIEIRSFDLLKNAYHAHLANKRNANAIAKTRSDVRGGGKKPWKQKGTGRARHGSIRSPIWKGGGVVFGPTGRENHKINLNKKARKRALMQALTLKQNDESIYGINSLSVSSGKTKDAQELIESTNLERKILIAFEPNEIDNETIRSFKNIPNVNLKRYDHLSVFEVINADNIIFTKNALDKITGWLSVETKEKANV